jgi:AraC-like DNA-binding protein
VDAGTILIGLIIDAPRLRYEVGLVARALDVDVWDLTGGRPAGRLMAAVVVDLASPRCASWHSALGAAQYDVPLVLIASSGSSASIQALLALPDRVRPVVKAVLDPDASLQPRLLSALERLIMSERANEQFSEISRALGADTLPLKYFIRTILSDSASRTTLGRALRMTPASARSIRRAIISAGFHPPSTFHRAVRVLGAHALLSRGISVEVVARMMGYSSSDVLREHFRRSLGMTPSAARDRNVSELASRVARTC